MALAIKCVSTSVELTQLLQVVNAYSSALRQMALIDQRGDYLPWHELHERCSSACLLMFVIGRWRFAVYRWSEHLPEVLLICDGRGTIGFALGPLLPQAFPYGCSILAMGCKQDEPCCHQQL